MLLTVLSLPGDFAIGEPSEQQLARWLKLYPKADANGDGRLTLEEARAYRRSLRERPKKPEATTLATTAEVRIGTGAPPPHRVDPGWNENRFPDHAVCYRTPKEIAEIYAKVLKTRRDPVTSYPKPKDGSLRIVGTGHSFMGPGYRTFPLIARAAGFEQPPLLTNTGGGRSGSARVKWELENGIFEADGRPFPKLLASIANAEWDAMMWGPFYHDRPEYYSCWIDFCLKYNPQMKFYLMNGWPQIGQFSELPKSEEAFTVQTIARMGDVKKEVFAKIIRALNKQYPGRVFVLPTCDAMVLAAQHYLRDELPGVEGIHRLVGKKQRSLWRDHIGHLGPGFDRLEGYVFYATLYGRSPELIDGDTRFGGSSDYPSRELDRIFRKIAWQAVLNNPLSGVTDKDNNGVGDRTSGTP
jgi:hypothetical protein